MLAGDLRISDSETATYKSVIICGQRSRRDDPFFFPFFSIRGVDCFWGHSTTKASAYRAAFLFLVFSTEFPHGAGCEVSSLAHQPIHTKGWFYMALLLVSVIRAASARE